MTLLDGKHLTGFSQTLLRIANSTQSSILPVLSLSVKLLNSFLGGDLLPLLGNSTYLEPLNRRGYGCIYQRWLNYLKKTKSNLQLLARN